MKTRLAMLLLLLPTALGTVWAPHATAQPPQIEHSEDFDTESDAKKPSFFRRPEMDTPSAQLAYADGLRDREKFGAAMDEYRALVHQWHDSPEAPQAQYSYAELLMAKGSYQKAFEEFQYLHEHYAGNYPYDTVLDHQFRMAHLLMTNRRMQFLFFPGFRAPERAVPMFEGILDVAPNWEHSHLAQFNLGVIHEELEEFEEAVAAYEIMYYRYPRSPHTPEAIFRRAVCLYELAQRAPRDENATRDAISALSESIQWFPEYEHAATARALLEELKDKLAQKYFNIARFYDEIVDKPQSAEIAYETFLAKFPQSEKVDVARARLNALQQETLQR